MIWHDLASMGIPVAEKALRTAAVYLGIVVLLRFAGKRDLAQLTTFDLVVMLLLSNVVQNAIIGEDNSLVGGLLGAAILLAINAIFARSLTANNRLARALEGTATDLVTNGTYDRRALRKEGLREVDVELALRRQNANDIHQVATAVLEPSGALVVTLKDDEQAVTKADLRALEKRLMAALKKA